MLLKWKILENPIREVEDFPPTVLELIPAHEEHTTILKLIDYLSDFESVSKALQGSGTERKSKYDVRVLFDAICAKFDEVNDNNIDKSLKHIRRSGAIVNNPYFENGIVKIQGNLESTMNAAERNAVKMFLKKPNAEQVVEEEGFADRAIRANAVRHRGHSAYRSTQHVLSIAVINERLFSGCRLVMSHLRSHMDPDMLELTIFLKVNKNYWLDARVIDDVLAREI